MDIHEFLKPVVLIFGTIIVSALAQTGFALWRAHSGDYRLNRERMSSWLDPLRGTSATHYDGVRDFRVRAGLAIDTRTNQWVEQGTLSEESLDSVLRR